MKREILTQAELERPRTTKELREFLDQTFDAIRQDKNARKNARARKGLYKRLIEELWPLSWYFQNKYPDPGYRLKLQLGNQGFDAVVLDDQDTEIERMEASWPIDGNKHVATVRLLNETGCGPSEIYDDHLYKLRQVFQQTIGGAKKKAVRNYTVKGHSSLVIIVDPFPYYHADIPEHRAEVEGLVKHLSNIEYLVDEVVVLLSPTWEVMKIK